MLVVDDQELFRRGLTMLLAAETGVEVVGEAGDGLEGTSLAATAAPDVVLLDIRMPGLDGFAVAERLAAGTDPPVVVLISSRDATSYARRLAHTLARGFIAKADLTGESLAAVVA